MTDETTDDATEQTETETPDRSEPRSDRPNSGESTRATDRQGNESASGTAGTSRKTRRTSRQSSTGRSPVEYVYWGGLIVFSLLAIVALFTFYSSSTRAISTWVSMKYEPIIQAAFALVILLGALVGVSLTVRELSPKDSE
ncbi:MAG: hypothetical protein ACI9PP_002479 [Halobacteriales archaeon]|jgi:hypothetical protein